MNHMLLNVFNEVNLQRGIAISQKQIAEKQTKIAKEAKLKAELESRRIYANDLSYKSQVALRNGDRTIAYRLAEFAYKYVDNNNYNVINALIQSIYYNDDPNNSPIPWSSIQFNGHSADVSWVAFFSRWKKTC